MTTPIFDPTITLGAVLQVVTLLIGGGAVYVRISNRLTALETKLDVIYKWWERQSERPK